MPSPTFGDIHLTTETDRVRRTLIDDPSSSCLKNADSQDSVYPRNHRLNADLAQKAGQFVQTRRQFGDPTPTAERIP